MRGFGKTIRRTATALALALAAGPAAAAVTYSFEGLSAFGDGPYGSFTFTAPNFITSDTAVPVANLSSCSITFPAVGVSCEDMEFVVDAVARGFTGTPSQAIKFGHTGGNRLYYFSLGSFGAVGTYNSFILGSEQAARLTVSRTGGPGPVPEPATWAMMILGFGAVGGAMRYRRRQVRVSFG